MALRISVIVGNPKPASRTLRAAKALAENLRGSAQAEIRVIDLVDHVDDLFKWPAEQLTQLAQDVASADLAIFATPTYKASHTGMMKAFLDRYPASGLEGLPAICLMTGGSPHHSMAPIFQLAPILAELGAVPLASVYFCTTEMGELDPIIAGHADRIRRLLSRLNRLSALEGKS